MSIADQALRQAVPAKEGEWTHGAVRWVSRCPCCGEPDAGGGEFKRADDEGTFRDIWTYRHCRRCLSMFLQNRPDEESLPKAYETYYTHSARDVASARSSKGLIAACVNAYLNYRFLLSRSPSWFAGGIAMAALPPLAFQLNVYGRHVPRSAIRRTASLLDVGCGNGDYLEIAKEMGLQAKGCEPDAKAVAVCRSRSLDVVHGDINAFRKKHRSTSSP